MGIELARAYITVGADMRSVVPQIQAAKPGVENALLNMSQAVSSGVGFLAAGVVQRTMSTIAAQLRESLSAAISQITAESRLAAVIEATGNAARYTVRELSRYAGVLQSATGFGDDAILEAQAALMRFGQAAVGAFRRTTRAALDMAAATGTDVKGAMLQLGMALEDPERGLLRLRRAGVMLGEQQQELIATFVRLGDLQSAQAVILGEIEQRYGGVAEQMAQTDVGKLQQAKNALDDLKEKIGKELIPLQKLWYETLHSILSTLNNAFSGVGQILSGVGSWLAQVGAKMLTAAAAVGALVVALKALAAAASFALAHPVVAGLAAVAAAAVAIGAAIQYASGGAAQFQEMVSTMRDARIAADEKRRTELSMVETLAKLAEKENLANAERRAAKHIIEELTKSYGDLGVKMDEATGKITGVAEAQKQLNEKMRSERIRQLEKELTEVEQNRLRAYTNIYTEQNRFNLWRTLGFTVRSEREQEAFESFRETEQQMAELRAEIERLRAGGPLFPAEEEKRALEENIRDAQKLAEARARIKEQLDERLHDLRIEEIESEEQREIESAKRRYAKMIKGAEAAGVEVWNILQTQEAEIEHIREKHARRRQRAEEEEMARRQQQEEQRWQQRASSLTESLSLYTPFERLQQELDEIMKVWNHVWKELPEGPTLMARALERLHEKLTEPSLLSSGITGFAEFGRSLQQAVLGRKDPLLQVNEEQKNFLQKITDLLRDIKAQGARAGALAAPGGAM